MASDSAPLTLIVPSDLRYLPISRVFVEAVCQSGGLDQASTDAVVLSTYEATANVMRHAHRGRTEVQVQLQCRFLRDGIEVCLIDEGEPFDLESVPHMDPSEIRVGGRGVFLMRSLMDELSCLPRDGGGNTLRMFKRFPENSSEKT